VLRAVVALVVASALGAGCTPDQLAQPDSGDGWRLLGWTRGGEPRPPAVGEAAIDLLGELDLRRMDRAVPGADPLTEVDVVVTHAVSGSCPQVRFDGFEVDEDASRVEAGFTDIGDLLFFGGCTADANPAVYWLAVERASLPAGEFVLATDKAPDVETTVDLGGE
jgi:hypothetical protein